MDPTAQALEQRVHGLWETFDRAPETNRESPELLGALRKLAADVARADLPFTDWQVLYRELLQLDRALRGHGQLIIEAEAEVETMGQSDPSAMGTADLLKELAADSALLAKRQLTLAELEAKRDVKRGVKSAELFGASGLFAYAALIMLLVAGALALGSALGQTLVLGALAVAAVLLMPATITGIVGYRRVKRMKPMARTRAELTKEQEWTKSLTTTT
jgi:uncharacterized membrane protein YqjE